MIIKEVILLGILERLLSLIPIVLMVFVYMGIFYLFFSVLRKIFYPEKIEQKMDKIIEILEKDKKV